MKTFFIFFSLICSTQLYAQQNNYYNQPLPSDTPTIFAPGIISDEFGNRDMAISPKGDEIFYTLQFGRGLLSTIMYTKKQNGKWSQPEIASFCGVYNDLEPSFSADGNTLYFVSNRALDGKGPKKDYDIWFVQKQNGNWGNPQRMPVPVNSVLDEFYPSVAKSGNIYFTREVMDREEDIMVCTYNNGTYAAAVSLPDAINSDGDEFNAFVDPDEQFIIFTAYKRKDDMGNGDLYISKKNNAGEWQQCVHLPPPINSKNIDYCPYITPDKKYFFFTSSRNNLAVPFKTKQTKKSLYQIFNSPQNTFDDIYWMKADAIIGK